MTSGIRKRITTTLAATALCATSGSLYIHAAQPQSKKQLYSALANPAIDIAQAERVARREHKRVLLDFGGDWCGDCQLLDLYYQEPMNAEILVQHYVVVHVDIGHMDHNLAIARKYRVPILRGVPALAVLDSKDHLLYVERDKEFEHTSAEGVRVFLDRWK